MPNLSELINKCCPKGVQFKHIYEIADTNIGLATSVSKNKASYGVRLLHNSDIQPNKIVIKKDEYITEAFAERNKGKLFRYHDIITVHTGDVGTSAVIEEEYVGSIGFTTITTRINNIDEVNPYYLCHYLNSSLCKKDIARETISDRSNLNQKSFAMLLVPLPPMEVQNEIVKILDEYAKLETEIEGALSKEMANTEKRFLFYSSSLINSLSDSLVVPLEKVCEVYDGVHQTPNYTDSGVRFVSVENIDDLYGSQKYISESDYDKFKIKPQIGDVFMTRITAGIIGKCTIVDREEPLAYYVSLALLRHKPELLPDYLKCFLESGAGRLELDKHILWNATPTKINKGEIGKINIVLPSIEKQMDIVTKLNEYRQKKDQLLKELNLELECRRKQYDYYIESVLTFNVGV